MILFFFCKFLDHPLSSSKIYKLQLNLIQFFLSFKRTNSKVKFTIHNEWSIKRLYMTVWIQLYFEDYLEDHSLCKISIRWNPKSWSKNWSLRRNYLWCFLPLVSNPPFSIYGIKNIKAWRGPGGGLGTLKFHGMKEQIEGWLGVRLGQIS